MANDSRLNNLTYPAISFAFSFWLQEKMGSWVAAPFPFPFHLPPRRATFNLIIYITLTSAIRHCTNTRSEGSTWPKEPQMGRGRGSIRPRDKLSHSTSRGQAGCIGQLSAWWH